MRNYLINPGALSLKELSQYYLTPCSVKLSTHCYPQIEASATMVQEVVQSKTVYGINTGFGLLASSNIPEDQLEQLQRNIVLSHAAGVGELLPDNIVALIILLKAASLAQGYSGVRLSTIHALIALLNAKIYPCIPEKGSVGASGDLAPLAHMACALMGEGQVRYNNEVMLAHEALAIAGLQPVTLAAKEGLALLNGTQVSTAIALSALFGIENTFLSALVTGCLSVDALLGSVAPFDERIHRIRRHQDQQEVAACLRALLDGSEISASHENCDKVQDPYSLRCQPQVMGACLSQMKFAAHVLLNEANAVTDNPLVFAKEQEILSGGNFHAEPVAMAADNLALAIAEIASIAERRIAILVDPKMSQLPAFLVKNSGVNSGFMLAHVTAAALVSENKALAYPSSVDSIPTSANQEDHVSMATYAARRLLTMNRNAQSVIAIEYLAACQGLDFNQTHRTSEKLQKAHDSLRQVVPYYEQDRYFAADIGQAESLIEARSLSYLIEEMPLFSSYCSFNPVSA